MAGEEVKANYESTDVVSFKSNLLSVKDSIEKRLLGEGTSNNVFAAITQAKSQISTLV